MRAPPLLWLAAGRPNPRRDVVAASGECYWCATRIVDEACHVADVISDSFTDQDQALVRHSPWLCPGCAWAMTGRPPDTLRLWTVVYREDGAPFPSAHPASKDLGPRIHLQNKADPSGARAILLVPPVGRWICSVADSGQIHTLPFAPVNDGASRYGVRFERATIWTTPAEYRRIDDAIRELLAAGFSKEDIARRPAPYRLTGATIEIWRRIDPTLAPYRGGPLLDLALFLTRKDKTDATTAAAADDRTTELVGDPIRDRDPSVDRRREDQADGLAITDRGGARDGGRQRSLFGDGLFGGAQAPGDPAPGAHRQRTARRRG